MKRKLYIFALVVSAVMLLWACSPDEHEMAGKDVEAGDLVEGLAYSITHDSDNPNIVYLTNMLGSQYTALWEHPQGRSQGDVVTLKMPFAGTYSVTFGVMTRGGIVYGDPTTFTIDDFCSEFVDNELWTYISGGVGNSKKWFLDLDENGVSKYFSGPVYFYGTDDSWATISGGETVDGDSWSWEADWGSVSGWQFNSYAMDYGYMEFSLAGGSTVTVVMNDLDKTFSGTYMLDTDNHTIQLTDAELLHDTCNDSQVDSWSGTMKLLSLNESAMQIGVVRASEPCILSFNFISEDYYNSWIPESGDEDVTPELSDDWQDYVTQITTTALTWKISADTPFDWCNLDGSRKNSFESLSDYPSWCTPASNASDITLTLNSTTSLYSVTLPDGTEVSGSFTLSSDGVYTFDSGLSSCLIGSDYIYFSADDDNQLRLMSYEVNSSNTVSDIWLGVKEYNASGSLYQYLAYHFEIQSDVEQAATYEMTLYEFDTNWVFQTSTSVYVTSEGTYTATIYGSDSNVYGIYLDIPNLYKDYPNCDILIIDIKVDDVSIEFDDSIIDRGSEDGTTARRYICNPWGATADTASSYTFASSISVTVQISFDTGSAFVQ